MKKHENFDNLDKTKDGDLKREDLVRGNEVSSSFERSHSAPGKELALLTSSVIAEKLKDLEKTSLAAKPIDKTSAKKIDTDYYASYVTDILEKGQAGKIDADSLFGEIKDYFGKHFTDSGVATTESMYS